MLSSVTCLGVLAGLVAMKKSEKEEYKGCSVVWW